MGGGGRVVLVSTFATTSAALPTRVEPRQSTHGSPTPGDTELHAYDSTSPTSCALLPSSPLPHTGGTHHAFADAGSGFCILNDLAYTAAVLLKQGSVQRVLILDLDVHQVGGWG